ncbi:hypothetical protein JCM18904_2363 [Vibrio sp. JCM 18904]|nr:hypothetical protein JCM18904_2363 [Vibrio sp. JCM 18904]
MIDVFANKNNILGLCWAIWVVCCVPVIHSERFIAVQWMSCYAFDFSLELVLKG